MRNPLHALIGTIDLIANTDKDEIDPKIIKSGKFSGELLLALIGNILDFSKIQAKKMESAITSIDLREKVSNIMSMFENRAKTNNLYLHSRISPNLPPALETDDQKLNQVLINLLGNALKFTSKGGVSVNIEWIELDNGIIDQTIIKKEIDKAFLLSSRNHFLDQIDEEISGNYKAQAFDIMNRKILIDPLKKNLRKIFYIFI